VGSLALDLARPSIRSSWPGRRYRADDWQAAVLRSVGPFAAQLLWQSGQIHHYQRLGVHTALYLPDSLIRSSRPPYANPASSSRNADRVPALGRPVPANPRPP